VYFYKTKLILGFVSFTHEIFTQQDGQWTFNLAFWPVRVIIFEGTRKNYSIL